MIELQLTSNFRQLKLTFLLFKRRWRHCWHAATSGQLTKNMYQVHKYIYWSDNSSLNLMQPPQVSDKQFKTNYMANFEQFFSRTPCIMNTYYNVFNIFKQYMCLYLFLSIQSNKNKTDKWFKSYNVNQWFTLANAVTGSHNILVTWAVTKNLVLWAQYYAIFVLTLLESELSLTATW